MSNDINDIFENAKPIHPMYLSPKIRKVFEAAYGEDVFENKTFYLTEVKSDEVIYLGETAFDMRGDGETSLLKENLINLEIISATEFYAVNVYVCKKINPSEVAYAFYQLDDDFHVLRFTN